MKLSQLRAFLANLGISPKKSLSQNFLIDHNILEKVIALADIHKNENVLEIGPGPGIITRRLLEVGANLTAVELDKTFAAELRALDLSLIEGDILKVELPKFEKVVSNLPYHLTAPILARLLPLEYKTLTLFVQDEVAKRIVAKPGSKDYGSLTLLVQFYGEVKYGFKVPKNCFFPAPKVDSAVIQITKKEPPAVDPKRFFEFVHTAFQGRRKMVATTWRKKYNLIVKTEARPENLSMEQFLEYYTMLEER